MSTKKSSRDRDARARGAGGTRALGTSRIPGFYRLSLSERRQRLAAAMGLEGERAGDLAVLDTGGLDLDTADSMIENVVGTYALPLGIGLNFLVNGVDYLVPMAVEEPSVVAAASNAAKIVRAGGGFAARVTPPVMIGQVQICEVADPDSGAAAITAARDDILARARALVPRLVDRGGGPVDVQVRILSRPGEPDGGMLVVHVLVDCRDAMGANLVNSLAEGLAGRLADLAGGVPGLRILSNLADERMVTITARVPDRALAPERLPGEPPGLAPEQPPGQPADQPPGQRMDAGAAPNTRPDTRPDSPRTDDARAAAGARIRAGIVAASRFAELDPYRAATHNKGIMNGVDAVLLATGNDWRGVEAGAHAHACRGGRYAPLAVWRDMGGVLTGELTMPLAVGTVGGALHVHRGARLALDLLAVSSASELATVVASVGLASNLAALRALASDGIQRGHMFLHARMVARAAGATGDLAERLAQEMAAAGDIKAERAREILERLRHSGAARGYTWKELP